MLEVKKCQFLDGSPSPDGIKYRAYYYTENRLQVNTFLDAGHHCKDCSPSIHYELFFFKFFLETKSDVNY